MKINVFDIKFKTNPNQPIAMTKNPFILEVPDHADVNSYIAAWFNGNCGAVPTFDWELVDEDDLVEKIRMVLRRYFETNDDGENNPEYDPDFSAQDAIDEIHDIIGDI